MQEVNVATLKHSDGGHTKFGKHVDSIHYTPSLWNKEIGHNYGTHVDF